MLQSSSPVPGTLVDLGERSRGEQEALGLGRGLTSCGLRGRRIKGRSRTETPRVGTGAPSEPVVRGELIREHKLGTGWGVAAGQASPVEGPASMRACRPSHRRGPAGRKEDGCARCQGRTALGGCQPGDAPSRRPRSCGQAKRRDSIFGRQEPLRMEAELSGGLSIRRGGQWQAQLRP